jgi:hypothetical protein
MPFLPLGPFRPDQPDTVPGRLANLLNASLKVDGESVAYGPLPGLLLVDPGGGSTTQPKGSLTCVTAAGAYVVFVMFDDSIYKVTNDGSYTLLASGYNLPAGDRWGACQFGKYAIFTNTFDGMLQYDIELGGAVTAVTDAPRARVVRVVFDSVFALDCDDDNKLIQYSSVNEHTNWTTGTSGYQPCPDGEQLQDIAEVTDGTALVFQRNAIRTLYRSDSILMFTMRKPIANKGAINPWCIVPVNGGAFFIDTNGFGFATAEGITPIGRGKVDRWWLADLEASGLASVQGAYDAEREVIRWLYHKAGADDPDGEFEFAIDFDITTGEFAPVGEWGSLVFSGHPDTTDSVRVSVIFTTASPGYTMEELDQFGDMDDMDDPNMSLDDRFWFGGVPQLGVFVHRVASGGAYYLAYFSGNTLAATFETTTLSDNQDSRITFIRPVTDAETIELQVGRSQRLQDALTWNTAAGLQPSGRVAINPETRGKNHRIRATIDAADTTFSYIRGFEDVKYTPPGGVK